jgi:hypothetical protein
MVREKKAWRAKGCDWFAILISAMWTIVRIGLNMT